MKASSDGSTTQPSVSAHQSASTCGSAESTAIWKSKGIAVVSFRSVQVSEQGDLRPAAIGAGFTVLAPPELISCVRDVAGRLQRMAQGSAEAAVSPADREPDPR